jgi:hypothetical protein
MLGAGVLALSATGAAQAAPAAIANHKVAGTQSAISCLTATRCVAAGEAPHGHGDVVSVDNGRPGPITIVRSAAQIYAVSCPSSAGCWALGVQNSGAHAVLVKIESTGKVSKSLTVTVPAGVGIVGISCVSMTSCEVAGGNGHTLEVGTWNGSKLHLYSAKGPRGSSLPSLYAVSCWHATCAAVGYANDANGTYTGLILITSRGKPVKLHTAKNDNLYGVWCASAKRCYAVGYLSRGLNPGIVLTLNYGAVAHTQQTQPAEVFGIECDGPTCRASGRENGGNPYLGVIVTLVNGTTTGTQTDKAIDGFDEGDFIARRGNGFAAVGPQQKGNGSLVATG